jgi:P pilus assembly chaperone PapD
MKCLTGLVLSFLMIASSPVLAGVVMGGTRVIYPQNTREVAFSVTNMENSTPYLIQSWVENYDRRNKSQPPFIVTPPLFRLDPEQTNTLRIRYTGAPLPTDRESVFWLNVKEAAIKWSAAPDMTPQTVLYRRPVAQFSNFQPKIVSSWLILALFQANFLISGRSRLCPYQLVNSNQVRQGE